jgi:hypothetical protein
MMKKLKLWIYNFIVNAIAADDDLNLTGKQRSQLFSLTNKFKVRNCKKNLIYISHPYQDKKENIEDIEKIINSLAKKYDEYTFVSPVHCFGFMYTTVSYDRGLDFCLDLLDCCEQMWVFGDYTNSTGCTKEIEYCIANNIKYKIFS